MAKFDRKHNISHEHVLHVPCSCSPTGRHRVHLGFMHAPKPGRARNSTLTVMQLIFVRSECDAKMGDAVRRLGGQTCYSLVRDTQLLLGVAGDYGYAHSLPDPENPQRQITPSGVSQGVMDVLQRTRDAVRDRATSRRRPLPETRGPHARLVQSFLDRRQDGVKWTVTDQGDGRFFVTSGGSTVPVMRRLAEGWFAVQRQDMARAAEGGAGMHGSYCRICPKHEGKLWKRMYQHAGGKEHVENFARKVEAACLALRRLGKGTP